MKKNDILRLRLNRKQNIKQIDRFQLGDRMYRSAMNRTEFSNDRSIQSSIKPTYTLQ